MLAAVAVVAIAQDGGEERSDVDLNLNREVRRQQVARLTIGMSQAEVERRLGGPGGRHNDPASYPEPANLDCVYYLELGGVEYFQLCYRDGRLAARDLEVYDHTPDG